MAKRVIERRSMDLKGLKELRNDKVSEMQSLVNGAKKETRALNDDEQAKFSAIDKEINDIDATIKAEERALGLDILEVAATDTNKEQRAKEEALLLSFLGGEQRALGTADNGAVIPTTIANKIIELVKEISPMYSMATVYNVAGKLVFPVWDESTPIQAAYVEDMTELTEGSGKFTQVALDNYIAGVLVKVSKSLMNRSDFDLVSFVVRKVAEAIAEFLEKECLVGTAGKMTGVFSSANVVTAASASAITADELIDLQMEVPETLQAKASWIMHKSTLKILRKLKNNDGDYILNKDMTNNFGWTLLGKPVYISKNAPVIAADTGVIVYGDMSGLHVKLAQKVEIQILLEKYATQHAVGIVGYVEADSKIVEPQKIAILKMKA